MAKQKIQTDWAEMSDYKQRMEDRGYLDKAKKYLNSMQNQIAGDYKKFGQSAYGAPYEDPAWNGNYTAQVMKFQDYFHPAGTDRSDKSLLEAGQKLADKLAGPFAPGEEEKNLREVELMGNKLAYIGGKRGIDFNPPSVDEYLKTIAGLKTKRSVGGY